MAEAAPPAQPAEHEAVALRPRVDPASSPPTRARLNGPDEPMQEYFNCIGFHFALPWVPVLIQLGTTAAVTAVSLDLFGFLYVLGLGVTSKSKGLFGVSMVVAILFLVMYSMAIGASAAHAPFVDSLVLPLIGLATMIVAHLAERYNRHVVDRAPFLEIGRKEDRR